MGQGGGWGPGDAGRETGCMGQATSSQLLSQVWGRRFGVTWFVRHTSRYCTPGSVGPAVL